MGHIDKNGVIITDEWMDTIAKAAEADDLPGIVLRTETNAGRPKLYEDEMKTVSLRIPLSIINAVDLKAQQRGETRSQRIREALVADLTRL